VLCGDYIEKLVFQSKDSVGIVVPKDYEGPSIYYTPSEQVLSGLRGEPEVLRVLQDLEWSKDSFKPITLVNKVGKMEIQTKDSYLKFHNLHDKELLNKCVIDVTNLLDEYPPIKIYGNICHQRRCIGFFSDESIGYHYSNQLSSSKPMTISLVALLTQINHIFGANYNGILINKYKTGEDYISAHSDDEKNLDDSGVVSISYGATRKFRIRDKKTKKIIKDFALESYSIIQMGGKFQQEFTHEVPIERKIKDERISFTFRRHIV